MAMLVITRGYTYDSMAGSENAERPNHPTLDYLSTKTKICWVTHFKKYPYVWLCTKANCSLQYPAESSCTLKGGHLSRCLFWKPTGKLFASHLVFRKSSHLKRTQHIWQHNTTYISPAKKLREIHHPSHLWRFPEIGAKIIHFHGIFHERSMYKPSEPY